MIEDTLTYIPPNHVHYISHIYRYMDNLKFFKGSRNYGLQFYKDEELDILLEVNSFKNSPLQPINIYWPTDNIPSKFLLIENQNFIIELTKTYVISNYKHLNSDNSYWNNYVVHEKDTRYDGIDHGFATKTTSTLLGSYQEFINISTQCALLVD